MVNSTETPTLWRFIGYLIYYPAVIIFSSWLDLKYFKPLGIPNLTASFLFLELGLMILTGGLLALPNFTITLKKHSSWNFDWVRVFAISIPIVCCLFAPLILNTSSIKVVVMYAFLYTSPLIPIYGIVLGYTLLGSFYKQ